MVLAQLVAQPSRVHAHDRISRGVEIRAFAIQLDSDHLLFERVAVAVQGLFDDEFQKGREAIGAGENLTGENSLELDAHE